MTTALDPRAADGATQARGATSGASQRRSALVPTGAGALFVLLATIVCVGRPDSLLNGDGDLARHLRVGAYILQRHALFYHDVFSYTMLGKPFVPYEWLSEVLYTLAYQIGGLAGVAVLAGLIIATTYTLVTQFLSVRSVDPILAFAVGALAAATGALHWLARPHLFTALGAVVLLFVMEQPGKRRLWPIVPVFVLWTNLHGGYLFGLALICIYLVGDLAESWLSRDQDRTEWYRRAIFDAKALGLALLACCANPSGLELFAHVTGYFGQRYLIDHTQEYLSPTFHVFSTQIFLGVLILVLTALALARTRPPLPHLLLVAVDLAFALYSVRNIPLFAVTALPIVALDFDPVWRRLLASPNRLALISSAISRRFARGEAQARLFAWPALATLVLVGAALNHGEIAGFPLVDARFEPSVFPVAAVQRARAAHLTGRIFNEFEWGGYLLYAWPEQKVFIDGQTDLYGETLTRTYAQIVDLDPGWRDALRSWDVSLVIVPADSALAAELEREPHWSVWYRDKTAEILQRNG
ncbi:MAG TPA: hypothetical protein VNL16_14870 [Chloroflexota bacterium]|nr:hypothetical protein [Chloroflexota bacterium]